MKRRSDIFLLIVSALVLATVIFWPKLRDPDPLPQNQPPVNDGIDARVKNLKLPEPFRIEVFTGDLPGARVLVQDGMGNFWVSRTSRGAVTLLEMENGKVARKTDVFRNLNNPHGLAIDPQKPTDMYIAESDKIIRAHLYSDADTTKIRDLPDGGRHITRTLGFGPDDRLYVSIGSSCDVCHEQDNRRAKIFSMKRDGSDFREEARGLRNSVFFTWDYVRGGMYATEMGRDWLGDDLPPDEINLIERGKNYGWPTCYGDNIHDTEFDKRTYVRNPCMEPFETPSFVDLQAHSAPLGLAFVPEEGWPEEYWYNILVSYHGSWNRSVPTGYKVVRVKMDSKGEYLGTEDFITGWIQDGQIAGRPVDIMIRPGGQMYITDDHAGLIYKVATKVPAQ